MSLLDRKATIMWYIYIIKHVYRSFVRNESYVQRSRVETGPRALDRSSSCVSWFEEQHEWLPQIPRKEGLE